MIDWRRERVPLWFHSPHQQTEGLRGYFPKSSRRHWWWCSPWSLADDQRASDWEFLIQMLDERSSHAPVAILVFIWCRLTGWETWQRDNHGNGMRAAYLSDRDQRTGRGMTVR